MKFYIRTLGCKMNQLDSARVAAELFNEGHQQVQDETSADVVLVNTCTVTSESDRKSRQAARCADRQGKRVVVLGCGPRVDADRWRRALPRLEIVGAEEELEQTLGIKNKSYTMPIVQRTRLPIPIQHGCDNHCAYCITRVARGPHRSEPLERVVAYVQQAASIGIREVVLTGINLAAWGCSNTNEASEARLPSLLRALLERTPVRRVRLSSLGPEYLNEEFFDVFCSSRICNHLHLSVQSGAEPVLRRMHRGHGTKQVLWAAEEARRARNDVALTADFIVGLPGESERDHQTTLDFVREVQFAQLHVFPFSQRNGTPAASMSGQVPAATKKRRSAELRALGKELRANFLESQYGSISESLVEGDGTALSSNYIRLLSSTGKKGEIVNIEVAANKVVELR